jgi:hypothetical protein
MRHGPSVGHASKDEHEFQRQELGARMAESRQHWL